MFLNAWIAHEGALRIERQDSTFFLEKHLYLNFKDSVPFALEVLRCCYAQLYGNGEQFVASKPILVEFKILLE